MSGEGNPTVADANASTGVEPLNAAPQEPQAPQMRRSIHGDLPTSPSSFRLPSGCEPIVLSLDQRSGSNSEQTITSLPNARQFEDLVKSQIHPPGPARAEEVNTKEWQTVARGKFEDVLEMVRRMCDSGQVKVFRLDTGVGKGEYYIVGLELDAERIVGVRVTDVGGK